MYLTLPEDARTGVIVNFHASQEYGDPVVIWSGEESSGYERIEMAKELVVELPYWEGQHMCIGQS